MTYLSELADKVVESVDPYKGEWGELRSIATIVFTDGTKLGVFIDSRELHYGGKEVNTSDLDKAFTDRFFKGGTIRTPDPPSFRFPKDPVLREIVVAFRDLKVNLMGYYGSHHKNPNLAFEEIVGPWEATVQRYFGYQRGNNLTSPSALSIQTNERRPTWLLKLSNWLPNRTSAITSPK